MTPASRPDAAPSRWAQQTRLGEEAGHHGRHLVASSSRNKWPPPRMRRVASSTNTATPPDLRTSTSPNDDGSATRELEALQVRRHARPAGESRRRPVGLDLLRHPTEATRQRAAGARASTSVSSRMSKRNPDDPSPDPGAFVRARQTSTPPPPVTMRSTRVTCAPPRAAPPRRR